MKKYKLLKNYPPYEKGDIVYNFGDRGYTSSKVDKQDNWLVTIPSRIIQHFDEWFAPYVFTTEDDVDIYIGDKFFALYKNKTISRHICTTFDGNSKNWKQFSTRKAIEEYQEAQKIPKWVICILPKYTLKLNMLYPITSKGNIKESKDLYIDYKSDSFREATKAEIKAHELGFHIGDSTTSGHTSKIYSVHSIGNITGFNYEMGRLTVKTDKDRLSVLDDNIQIDKPKLITLSKEEIRNNFLKLIDDYLDTL